MIKTKQFKVKGGIKFTDSDQSYTNTQVYSEEFLTQVNFTFSKQDGVKEMIEILNKAIFTMERTYPEEFEKILSGEITQTTEQLEKNNPRDLGEFTIIISIENDYE